MEGEDKISCQTYTAIQYVFIKFLASDIFEKLRVSFAYASDIAERGY